ncbi:MAG: transposase [Candidatus Aminicenantes bacterium]|nr:transposase [Candidatus Aminicenantes bacterium]
MYFARTAQKLREQMVRFSGELSAGLPKVSRRFVAEMVFGIQARGSVRLTEVGRSLGEKISLKKTEERLSRQLGRKGLERKIQRRLIEQAAPRIEDDTLLVLDLSDVTKKYAEKMENLAQVRDGSEKELGWGYWTLNIVGGNTKGTKLVPLYGRLYSHAVGGHQCENEEIREAVGEVAEVVGKRGIWVMDRGGDRRYIFNYLLPNKLRFLIRVRWDRGLCTAQGIEPAVDLALSCPMLFCETIVREEVGQERLVHLECGMRKVRLPGRREELTLVVVKGFGKEPLMILTNLAVRRSRKSVWHVVLSYITRWRIEDVIRFVKQSYRLEDIRCLTYHRLQALMVLVTAAAYFAAVYLGLRMKLRVLASHVLRASKRVFGIPDFRLYALADGIRQFLYSQTQGLTKLLELQNPLPLQPTLFDS